MKLSKVKIIHYRNINPTICLIGSFTDNSLYVLKKFLLCKTGYRRSLI